MRSMTRNLFAAGLVAMGLVFTGCLTDSKDDKKDEEVATPWLADSTLNVGAQADTLYGTAIDLDTRRAMKSLAANAAQDSLDVLFAFHNASFVLVAPRTAKDSGISVANNYDTTKVKYTKFVKVSTAPANWEAGVMAFDAGTQVSYSRIAAGDMFVVKTTEDAYALVTIATITGTTNAGRGTIKVNLKGLTTAQVLLKRSAQ